MLSDDCIATPICCSEANAKTHDVNGEDPAVGKRRDRHGRTSGISRTPISGASRGLGAQKRPATERPVPAAAGANPIAGLDLGAVKKTMTLAPAAAAPARRETLEAVASCWADCHCDTLLSEEHTFEEQSARAES